MKPRRMALASSLPEARLKIERIKDEDCVACFSKKIDCLR